MKKVLLLLFLAVFGVSTAFSQMEKPEAQKVAEFGNLTCEELKLRLDNLETKLKDYKDARLFVISYEGKHNGENPIHGEADSRVKEILFYLIRRRHIDSPRVVAVNGGFRADFTIEIWIVPQGADEPKPSPTLEKKDIEFRTGTPPEPRDCDSL